MAEFLLANAFWTGVAAVSAGGLLFTLMRDGAQTMEHGEAVLWVKREKGVFVDMRSTADFARGHIAQSRNIPADEFQNRASDLDRWKDKPVVLVCDRGMHSRRHLRTLSGLGFKHVRAMKGGMAAWSDAQMPLDIKGKKS